MSTPAPRVDLHQVEDYAFDLHFGPGLPALRVDEPPPLGRGQGPTPVQLLTAAVANCLSDSLLYALRRQGDAPEPLTTRAQARVGRNPDGRLRVLGLEVSIQLGVPAACLPGLASVLAHFEDFCTVSQSVAPAIPVTLSLRDLDGRVLR